VKNSHNINILRRIQNVSMETKIMSLQIKSNNFYSSPVQ